MLHALYGQSIKVRTFALKSRNSTDPCQHNCNFHIAFFALDLIMVDGACVGVVALDMETGTLHRMFSRNKILGTENAYRSEGY